MNSVSQWMWVGILSVVMGPAAAGASPEQNKLVELTTQKTASQAAPRNELRLELGFGAALGFGGLTYARSLHRVLDIEAGVGGGLTGVQLAAGLRVGFGTEVHRFIIGAGASMGTGSGQSNHTPVGWFNADIGYQGRLKNGITAMATWGVTTGLAGELERCPIGCWPEGGPKYKPALRATYPALRIGVG